MAKRINTEFALSAHTALQVMFCRAQITSNRDHLRVGVVCDLEREEFLIVNLENGGAVETQCLRVFEPVHDVGPVGEVTLETIPVDLAGNEELANC